MAITYSLAPESQWVLINLAGTVAAGGYIKTTYSLNKDLPKPIYQDPAGQNAWPNPTYFGLNGTQGPFYWKFDSAHPEDTYFVQAYDSEGTLLWEVDDFTGGGSGGGGNVSVYLPLSNYIANNVFINHNDPVSVAANLTNYVVAPSNHQGFTPSLINPVLTAYGTVGPDIRFNKNNTGIASDQITYPLFALASAPLNPDVTPTNYIRYQCTGTPAGETFKNFQFPVCQKVKNLSNQAMTFSIWAAVTTTSVTLTANVLQYFGSAPTADAPVLTPIDVLPLTTSWTQFVFNFTMPDVAGKSIGTLNSQTDDDAVYIQIELPHGTACDVLFTKPALYLGTVQPDDDFETYDQINSINSTFRTGDIKTSLSSSAPLGWVAMNDGSIGNVGSGATTRANQDTFQLYKTIWDGVLDAWAPVSTGRGATAISDFIANKTLTLPLSLGRALAGAGNGGGLTPRALGENRGGETVILAGANMPNGVPFNSAGSGNSVVTTSVSGTNVPSNNTNSYTQGSGTPVSVVQPSSFMNVFIKL